MNVFVYGTLKPGEINYQLYCADKVIQTTSAYTWGNLYHLNLGYPGMTLGNNKVEGVLLTFADESILDHLDRLEDYQPQRSPHANEYNRQRIPVYDLSGNSLGQAWGYVMSVEKVRQYAGIAISSGWWSQSILR